MNNTNNHSWSVSIKKEVFEKLRNDKAFISILRLERILNTIRYSRSTTLYCADKNTPESKRDTNASFFLMCALLYEFIKNLYEDLKPRFKDLQAFQNFQNLIESLISNENYELIKKVRDKVMFHFDPKVFSVSLEKFQVKTESVMFGESHTEQYGDFYCHLADELTFQYLMKSPETNDISLTRFGEFVDLIANFPFEFIQSAEILILEILEELILEKEKIEKSEFKDH